MEQLVPVHVAVGLLFLVDELTFRATLHRGSLTEGDYPQTRVDSY